MLRSMSISILVAIVACIIITTYLSHLLPLPNFTLLCFIFPCISTYSTHICVIAFTSLWLDGNGTASILLSPLSFLVICCVFLLFFKSLICAFLFVSLCLSFHLLSFSVFPGHPVQSNFHQLKQLVFPFCWMFHLWTEWI